VGVAPPRRPRGLLQLQLPFYALYDASIDPSNPAARFGRDVLEARKRWSIFMWWMATGDTFQALATRFGIGASTAHKICHTILNVMFEGLVPEEVKLPRGDELRKVMDEFQADCGLPYVAGAMDGTFIELGTSPEVGESKRYYWNYKQRYSIIALAIVDARKQFLAADIGRPGGTGDAATWQHSSLKTCLLGDVILNAEPMMLEDVSIKPYLIADGAFPLGPRVMKAYLGPSAGLPPAHADQRAFNNALCHGRRVVEMAFGRLKGRWRILTKNNIGKPGVLSKVTKVAMALHNVAERYNCALEEGGDVPLVLPQAAAPAEPAPPADAGSLAGLAGGQAVRQALMHHVWENTQWGAAFQEP